MVKHYIILSDEELAKLEQKYQAKNLKELKTKIME